MLPLGWTPKQQRLEQVRREGGQKGSLSGGPGTQGGPGFRIVRFRMQNSSAQTADAMMVFLISGQNSNICERYDLILLITRCWAEIWICGGYDPFFAHHLTLGRNSNICGRSDFFLLMTWFWGTTDQRAQTKFLPRGPKFLSAPLTWSFASGHGHISNSHLDTKYERAAMVKSSTYSIFECLIKIITMPNQRK